MCRPVRLIPSGVVFVNRQPAAGMQGHHLNSPVVGITPTPSSGGYWLVTSDGGVFSFGDAHFHGSVGGLHLRAAVVAMAMTPTGDGYWLAGADGGIFNFGAAHFLLSFQSWVKAPVVAISEQTVSGVIGYSIATRDGQAWSFP